MTLLSTIGSMSKIEYCNCCLGYIEEVSLDRFNFRESLYGMTRTVNFKVANAWRCEPLMECGTQTAAASAIILTDTAADFFRRGVLPGDIIINSTDCCSIFDVTGVTSKTVLTVRLNTAGGACSTCNFATSDVYIIRRRNAERVYVPNLTKIRVTNRCTNIQIFNGVVMEMKPESGRQARSLMVTANAFDVQLRDARPTVDVSCDFACGAIRSHVIRNMFDDKTCSNQLVFPLVAGCQRWPGIEGSPNLNLIKPDFTNSQRNALTVLLDMGMSEFWARTSLNNALTPATITHDTHVVFTELLETAEGSLAQRFEAAGQFCIGSVELRLVRVECACLPCLAGNMYVRIESEESTLVTTGPVPSGYLLAPWAESNLLNVTTAGTSTCCGGTMVKFIFDAPIALDACTGYWIVFSYQEKNRNENINATNVFIEWSRDCNDCGDACGCRSVATFSNTTNIWTACEGDSFNFIVNRFSEAVWFYDVSAGQWCDHTAAIECDNAAAMGLMVDCASGSCVGDRLYMGFAGPIRGIQLCYSTASSAQYGTWTAKYHGGHHAKLYGTITTTCASVCCLTLTDSTKNFSKVGICVGDIVFNITDNSLGIITAIAPGNVRTRMTVQDLFTNENATLACNSSKTFVVGDEYAVLGWEKIACGQMDGASCVTMTDATANFDNAGIRVGDIIVNESDNLVSWINSYTATTIVTTCGTMSWAACNCYVIYSRWRTLDIRDLNNTFTTPTCTLCCIVMEWTIPADWEPLRFTANDAHDMGPEATEPGNNCIVCSCHQRYFIVFQNTSVPATEAQIDVITALPGAGFGVKVSNTPRSTVICAFASAAANATACTLKDISRDFHGDANTVGIFICDTVDNNTDGSSGPITAITTSGCAASSPNCTLTVTLTGGACCNWTCADVYILRRNQYPLEYFRLGSRPFGGATRYGLTLVDGATGSCQMVSMYSADVSKSSRQATNKVQVTGKTICCGCACVIVSVDVEDKRGQREFKRTVQKSVVDPAVDTVAEATDRGEAEISRFVDAQERVDAKMYGWPTITKTLARRTWLLPGITEDSFARVNGCLGGACTTWKATGGAAHCSTCETDTMIDTGVNFRKLGVVPGDLLLRHNDCTDMIIVSICTTTNKNDTLIGVCLCDNCDNWACGDIYSIHSRRMLEVGELVRVRIADCVCTIRKNVDECYLVTNICYDEPSQEMNVRMQRNFSSTAVGDYRDDVDIISYVSDSLKKLSHLSKLVS